MREMAMAAMVAVVLSQSADAQRRQPVPDSLRWGWATGLHFGTPGIVSATVGRTFVIRESSRDEEDHADVFAVVEPGLHAGRVSLGYMDYLAAGAIGFTGRVTILRDWFKSSATYVGVEGAGWLIFGWRIGAFAQVSGPNRGSFLFTYDFQVGY